MKVHGGVIVDAAGDAVSADRVGAILRSNGFKFHDRFAETFRGQTLQLDDRLKIITRNCRCGHVNTLHAGGSGNCVAKDAQKFRCDCNEFREAMV